MRPVYYFLGIVLLIFIFNDAPAQQLKENEVVVIGGEKFVLHQVRTGETMYSISRQFMVDAQTLIKYNPKISDGLRIGDILKIPYIDEANWQKLPENTKGDPTHFEYYTITSRTQTPYFIAREFGITVEEIYAYNPEVSRFRKGIRLRIPRWNTTAVIPEAKAGAQVLPDENIPDDLIKHEVKPGETLSSLARQYKITESEILFFNPGARKLKAGSIIFIPRVEEGLDRELTGEKVADSSTGNISAKGNTFEHTIVSGETLWSLTRKYNVSEQELKSLNPVLESGFPAGVTIKIPVRDTNLSKAEPVNEDAFIKHQVNRGETMFGLSSKYRISIPEMRKFNPQLETRNLVVGETILVPRQPDKEIVEFMEKTAGDSLQIETPAFESDYYKIEMPEVIPENCNPVDELFISSAIYDVALFLPLFIHANDTLNERPEVLEIGDSLVFFEELIKKDTLVEVDEPLDKFFEFYRESENFLEFYEGVLLAVDSLQRKGMRIRLHVFDTQQSADSIRKFIYNPRFLETDLIIGPVYPQVQEEVSSISAKNRIPLISPLSSQSAELIANPYYYQVNPSRDFLAQKTAELVAEEYFNSNFIVVKTSRTEGSSEEKVVNIIREKVINSGYWGQPQGMQFSIYDFSSEGPFGFSRILSKNKENVIFVASLNEGDLSIILSNINNLSGEYSITLIGFNRYEQFHSIDEEFFHNLKLHYLAPYWVDYSNPETVRVLQKFRENYNTDPGNFGIQGYDVSFFFLNALNNYGKDFDECIPYQRVHLVQGNYRFEKVSQFGGYMNQGVSVVSYNRNYDVVRTRVIGPARFAQK